MKVSRSFSVTVLGLVAILAPIRLAAQSGTFRITVPFDFAVGSQPFPAGGYYVSSNSDGLVHLSSVDGHANLAVLSNPVDARSEHVAARLVFTRYGDLSFLSQIWSGSTRGNQLPKSQAERETIEKIERAAFVTVVASGQ